MGGLGYCFKVFLGPCGDCLRSRHNPPWWVWSQSPSFPLPCFLFSKTLMVGTDSVDSVSHFSSFFGFLGSVLFLSLFVSFLLCFSLFFFWYLWGILGCDKYHYRNLNTEKPYQTSAVFSDQENQESKRKKAEKKHP